jgi:hypothetical protein
MVRKRKLPALRLDEPFRALASSGAGVEVRSGTKGAHLSIARLPPSPGKGRRDERSTAGDPRGERASAHHAPGSRRVESILIAATALPFAGEAETGISIGRVMRKALQPSELMPPDDHRVLGSVRRRGTSRQSLKAKPARETGYLRSWRTDPYLHAVTASPTLGATDGGLEASPRTRRHEER